MKKPIIVYIESSRRRGFINENPDRDALSYFLRDHCGCEVVLYENNYYFNEGLSRLKKMVDLIILVIVKQNEYSEDHKQVIKNIRGLSKRLPIVVIPEGQDRFNNDPAGLVYVYEHTNPEMIILVKGLVSKWRPSINWLGAETPEDQHILLQQLENAYRKHYLGDETLGTPDYNHQVVAEAIRIKLLPSSLLKEEFDDTIDRKVRTFVYSEISEYEKELDLVRKMDKVERKRFNHCLDRARGYEPTESGGVYVIRASCGSSVNGFAIDPVTLENITTQGFGEHHLARNKLGKIIKRIEALKGGKKYSVFDDFGCDFDFELNSRIMYGLISNIEGFKTPILRLCWEEADDEGVKKVASFIRKSKMFIPVTSEGYLIGE